MLFFLHTAGQLVREKRRVVGGGCRKSQRLVNFLFFPFNDDYTENYLNFFF